jgi:hypothetical protein
MQLKTKIIAKRELAIPIYANHWKAISFNFLVVYGE